MREECTKSFDKLFSIRIYCIVVGHEARVHNTPILFVLNVSSLAEIVLTPP